MNIEELFIKEYEEQKETIKRYKATINLQSDHIDEMQEQMKVLLKFVTLKASIADGEPYFSFENIYRKFNPEDFAIIEEAVKLYGKEEAER